MPENLTTVVDDRNGSTMNASPEVLSVTRKDLGKNMPASNRESGSIALQVDKELTIDRDLVLLGSSDKVLRDVSSNVGPKKFLLQEFHFFTLIESCKVVRGWFKGTLSSKDRVFLASAVGPKKLYI